MEIMIKRRVSIQQSDPEVEVQGSDSAFHKYNEQNFLCLIDCLKPWPKQSEEIFWKQ